VTSQSESVSSPRNANAKTNPQFAIEASSLQGYSISLPTNSADQIFMNAPSKKTSSPMRKFSQQHSEKSLPQPRGNQKKNAAAKMGRIVQRYQGK
jgi:hypothetical protein